MAISSNIYRTRDLNEPTTIEHLPHVLAMGDDQGDQFSIAVTRGSVPVSLAVGACTGWFIRLEENKKIEECQTIILTGSVNSNVASIVLPESCYVTNGRFILTIFATLEGCRHAIYIGEGMVARTYTDTLVDPGKNIPDLSDLLAMLGQMESARSAAVEAAGSANSAAQAATQAAQNVTSAVDSANTAADKANAAASGADTSAQKADTAASGANTAATAANASATKADTAAAGADASAKKADTAADNANAAADQVSTAIEASEEATSAANTAAANANGEYEKFKNATFTATRLDNSEDPRLEVTEQDGHKVFDYYIPEGKQGPKGDTGDGDVSSVWGVRPDDAGDVKMPVGGRNLALKSNTLLKNNKYSIGDYPLSTFDKLAEGDDITISFKGNFADDRTSIAFYNSGGAAGVLTYRFSDRRSGTFYISGKWTLKDINGTTASSNTSLTLYIAPNSSASENTIEWVKLERGSVPTDWSPAPEDLESATGDAYSPYNPPPYPVSSVNGQTGAVIGTASMPFPDHFDFDQLTQEGIYLLNKAFTSVNYKNAPSGVNSLSRGICYVGRWTEGNDGLIQLLILDCYANSGFNKRGATIFVRNFFGIEFSPWTSFYGDGNSKPPYPVSSVNGRTGAVTGLYDASNPPPYPVSSVNGQTGVVNLNAASVGARPSTWTPTAAEVGALPSGTKVPTFSLQGSTLYITY